jgi:histidyl-tRNA synthetase
MRQGGRVKKAKAAATTDESTSSTGGGGGGGGSAWAPIRGTHDALPFWSARQRSVESLLAALASQFGYGELRTPVLERADLCARSLGAESDVVSKEMFRFEDRDGTDTVLRPEATASQFHTH